MMFWSIFIFFTQNPGIDIRLSVCNSLKARMSHSDIILKDSGSLVLSPNMFEDIPCVFQYINLK